MGSGIGDGPARPRNALPANGFRTWRVDPPPTRLRLGSGRSSARDCTQQPPQRRHLHRVAPLFDEPRFDILTTEPDMPTHLVARRATAPVPPRVDRPDRHAEPIGDFLDAEEPLAGAAPQRQR